ncbi:MAG TPA: hypothetical protein EYH34_12435 [Planctomycetes bacterium]|nr:hypothetical protein [Planctomycetota bacterium]
MGRSIRDFRDGTSDSILVGPVSPDRKIPWTKPGDVVFDENFPGIGKGGGFAAPWKTDKGSGGVFLRGDGSVTTIRSDVDMELLRNLIVIADGHPIPEVPTLEPSRPRGQRPIPVIAIERTAAGPTAKLVLETCGTSGKARSCGTAGAVKRSGPQTLFLKQHEAVGPGASQ